MKVYKILLSTLFIVVSILFASCVAEPIVPVSVMTQSAMPAKTEKPIPTKTSVPTQSHEITQSPEITHCPECTESSSPTISPTAEVTVNPTVSPESKPLSGMKICIDPGHQIKGNYDKEPCAPWNDVLKSKCTSGTSGNFTGVDEYLVNLDISLILRDKLTALGADVLMTREIHEVDISNKERAEMANDFGADITIRIHCNSAESEKAEGIDLFVRGSGDGTDAYKIQSDKDYAVAVEMLDYICNATGAKKRYVHKSDNYTGINWCDHTCVIVECGFMSNEKEDKLLCTGSYQEKIAQGIVDYFINN